MCPKSEIKLIFVVNHLSFFSSHWSGLVSQVVLPQNVLVFFGTDLNTETASASKERIERLEYMLAKNEFSSFGFNFLNILVSVRNLSRVLNKNINIPIHAVSPIGIVIAGVARLFSRSRGTFLVTISGLGSIFSDTDAKTFSQSMSRVLYKALLRVVLLLNRAEVIVENTSDFELIRGLVHGRLEPITLPGIGICRSQVAYSPERKKNIVLMPARVLRTKGVHEFCQAAKLLQLEFPDWRFIVAGSLDYRSPDRLDVAHLKHAFSGCVEFPGHVQEIDDLFIESKIVCLPSYREGLPRALIEAAAHGCAVVTTDVPGCRDAIIDNKTGILVRVKCVDSLTGGLRRLMQSPETIEQFAKNGIKLAYDKFDQQIVVNSLRKVYLEQNENH